MRDFNFDVKPLAVVFGLACAGIGWCVIELLIWVFSHLTWV